MKRELIFPLLLAVLSGQSIAHSLHLFAQFDGEQISGKAYYSDQTPARGTYVEAVQLGQSATAETMVFGKTDQNGRFVLPFKGDGSVQVSVAGMEGHRAVIIADNVTKATGQELQLLREDLQQLQNKFFFRDVLGGLGYLFGLFGLWSIWLNRKSKKDN